jgi:hypothetical protein
MLISNTTHRKATPEMVWFFYCQLRDIKATARVRRSAASKLARKGSLSNRKFAILHLSAGHPAPSAIGVISMADTTQVETATRERTTKRSFYNAKNEESARALPDTAGAKVLFVENDFLLEMPFSEIPGFDDIPEGVLRQGFAFGVMTSATNTVGSSKLTLDEKIEACEARWDSIKNGAWSAERESGPRTNDLLEAASRVQAASGKPWDDARKAAFASKLANEEGFAKTVESNTSIKAQLDTIKLERAQRRAEKSAKAAENTTGTASGLDHLF